MAAAVAARIIENYYTYRRTMWLTCRCGWVGRVKDAWMELFAELFDLSCPKCGAMLLIVSLPTREQTLAAAAMGNEEAIAILKR
jgi:hypothetical protein